MHHLFDDLLSSLSKTLPHYSDAVNIFDDKIILSHIPQFDQPPVMNKGNYQESFLRGSFFIETSSSGSPSSIPSVRRMLMVMMASTICMLHRLPTVMIFVPTNLLVSESNRSGTKLRRKTQTATIK